MIQLQDIFIIKKSRYSKKFVLKVVLKFEYLAFFGLNLLYKITLINVIVILFKKFIISNITLVAFFF